MVIVIALLVVLLVAGAGFAVHALWIIALALLALWFVGLVMGRGEGAGNYRFFRW